MLTPDLDRLQRLIVIVRSADYGDTFAHMPDGYFESREVRRAFFNTLPEQVQDLILSVGLSMGFGAFADARSMKLCDEAKARAAEREGP